MLTRGGKWRGRGLYRSNSLNEFGKWIFCVANSWEYYVIFARLERREEPPTDSPKGERGLRVYG